MPHLAPGESHPPQIPGCSDGQCPRDEQGTENRLPRVLDDEAGPSDLPGGGMGRAPKRGRWAGLREPCDATMHDTMHDIYDIW